MLDGVATITRDKARIKELWNFILKTWFTEGEHDPRITAIKITRARATTGITSTARPSPA
ncbi:pyridoxamine 5'-phosphate oxidase family protein [Massilia sp. DJPM01]|uniref:pyridoxamine 5'-phosphate oxidase family protein n=1 Tax=Massilia sp. DJPM01 TaxID=3024404 RepID=UPI0035A357B9